MPQAAARNAASMASFVLSLLLMLPVPTSPVSIEAGVDEASVSQHRNDPADPQHMEQDAALNADKAKAAADTAQQAAYVAKQVAAHSIRMTRHAQAALRHARKALHGARVGASGLSSDQQEHLKEAEARLQKAAESARYGNGTGASSEAAAQERALKEKLKNLKQKLRAHEVKRRTELDQMREEIHRLREKLEDSIQKQQLEEIERLLEDLETKETRDSLSHDELKAELERLRDAVKHIEAEQAEAAREEAKRAAAENATAEAEEEAEHERQHRGPRRQDPGFGDEEEQNHFEDEVGTATSRRSAEDEQRHFDKPIEEVHEEPERMRREEEEGRPPQVRPQHERPPAASGPLDVDMELPYGDLEPFGREDTAQELTEASIRESDAMVDQLERAEVAEEKRAVFRALTRLRGAAITSYDGVARSQTGNIDQFARANQWRSVHPVQHLANQESDISKWAFPDANL